MIVKLNEGEYFGDQLRSVETDEFKLSSTSNSPDTKTLTHVHENDYLSLQLHGLYHESAGNNEITVGAGDLIYRPKDYSHQNTFHKKGGICFNIELKDGWNEKYDINLSRKYQHLKSFKSQSLYKLVNLFYNNFDEDQAREYIIDCIDNINCNDEYYTNSWVKTITGIIQNNIETFHSLSELASEIQVNPSYLSRAFKKNTGVTISEYQMNIKLLASTTFLLDNKLSISDISYKTGFYDDSHFIRSFKSVYNISPHQFRLMFKK